MTLGKPVMMNMGYEEVVKVLRTTLEGEGFTIVNTLDIRKTMKDTFGVDWHPFLTFSVYHADTLKRVATEKPEAAIWMPWSISLNQVGERMAVTLPDPMALPLFAHDDGKWRDIASELRQRLERVLGSMQRQNAL